MLSLSRILQELSVIPMKYLLVHIVCTCYNICSMTYETSVFFDNNICPMISASGVSLSIIMTCLKSQ